MQKLDILFQKKNRMKTALSIVLIILVIFSSCNPKANKSNPLLPLKVSHYKMKCYNLGQVEICTPDSWRLVHQSKYLFYSYLDNDDSSQYFVTLKYNKLSSGLTIKKYLHETYRALMTDTVEKFNGYTCEKLVFNNKTSYYGEYYTHIADRKYVTMSMIYEDNSDLFEFALKFNAYYLETYKPIFGDILFQYKHDNEFYFKGKDDISKKEIIDLSKM